MLRLSLIHIFLQELYKHKTLYAMTLPALIFFLIFSYIPMLGVYYAFVDYDFAKGIFHSPFVGLKNFQYFISGGWDAPVVYLTRNTILYNLVFIFLGNILPVSYTHLCSAEFHFEAVLYNLDCLPQKWS